MAIPPFKIENGQNPFYWTLTVGINSFVFYPLSMNTTAKARRHK
jgi:hypothetical protein